MPGSRKLGRPTDHRKAMLRGMVTYLLENGKIETTVTRAKEVRAMAEKMITLGKNDTLHSRRQVLSYVTKEDVAKKLLMRLLQNTATETAVIAVLSKQAHVAATQLRCASSSLFKIIPNKFKGQSADCPFLVMFVYVFRSIYMYNQ